MLTVVGVYTQRAIRRSRARRSAPATVPSAVQQQSANFSYSDVEGGRTVFTIRASRATQFKEQERALLQDVWITVYGREGNRNDNIHTRECSYAPLTGGIRCEGEVQIDIQGANAASGQPSGQSVQLKTRDLTWDRQTGEASTAAPVEFSFAEGHGRGIGVGYSAHDATVRIDHSVEVDLNASGRAGGLPVNITGSRLEIRRNERLVVLAGPAIVRQGDRELSAGKISVQLDEAYHAQKAVAEGHPSIRGQDGREKFSLSAATFKASVNQQGWIEHFFADGAVAGTRRATAGIDSFLAEHIELAMLPRSNLIREMTAKGGVAAQSWQGADSRLLKTDSLLVTFSAIPWTHLSHSHAQSFGASGDRQRIASAETLAPATIESRSGSETVNLSARKFVAQFGASGRLEKLLGHDGVEVRRQVADGIPQTSSARELTAVFSSNGEWDSLEQAGSVRFHEADRQATAAQARTVRSTGLVTLNGSSVLSDSTSRTTAASVTISEQSGELQASGGVVSTYLATSGNPAANLGLETAHISSDSLSGSTSSGHIVYSGHARLWQGDSVLQAEQIEVWRDDQKLEAKGHVVAIFPQAPGRGPALAPPKSAPALSRPTLWHVRAASLTYSSNQARAHLEGGVVASSDQGSLESRTLDVFLTPAASPHPGSSSAATEAGGGQQVSRVLALGNVTVRQGDRRGAAEQAEYTAGEQKFVLSGGHPTLTDASSDTTTDGRSLTFFVASDTILIDSQDGLRTLTKHRVEK